MGGMVPIFKSGQLLTAVQLNQVVDAIIKRIDGGPGISVTRIGNRIVIGLANVQQIIPR